MRRLCLCCCDTEVVEPGTRSPPAENRELITEWRAEYESYLASAKQKFIKKYEDDDVPEKSIDDFKISGMLSQGHWSVVVKAKYIPNRTTCAIKIQNKAHVVEDKRVENVVREKRILQALDNPFIVKLLYVGQDFPNVYLMLEYAPYGDLAENGKNQSYEVIRHFAAQIVLALEYLHTCCIIYRDLKPKNVLIFEGGHVKLADFGLAKVCEGRTSTVCGDKPYCAPELLSRIPYTNKVDWWSFGVILHDLVFGELPFPGVGDRDHIRRICEDEFRLPKFIDADLQHLLKNLLLKDPVPRLGNIIGGEVDVKTHPYFKDVVCVHLFNDMKKIKLPKMSVLKPKDIDKNKLFPELAIDIHRDQFKDFC